MGLVLFYFIRANDNENEMRNDDDNDFSFIAHIYIRTRSQRARSIEIIVKPGLYTLHSQLCAIFSTQIQSTYFFVVSVYMCSL